jgi:hypothetical protein
LADKPIEQGLITSDKKENKTRLKLQDKATEMPSPRLAAPPLRSTVVGDPAQRQWPATAAPFLAPGERKIDVRIECDKVRMRMREED